MNVGECKLTTTTLEVSTQQPLEIPLEVLWTNHHATMQILQSLYEVEGLDEYSVDMWVKYIDYLEFQHEKFHDFAHAMFVFVRETKENVLHRKKHIEYVKFALENSLAGGRDSRWFDIFEYIAQEFEIETAKELCGRLYELAYIDSINTLLNRCSINTILESRKTDNTKLE